MPTGLQTAHDILQVVFWNQTGLVFDPGSTATANLYIGLHTSEPDYTQQEGECAYTGYARVLVPRDFAWWDILTADPIITLMQRITFPMCTAGSETALYWSIGLGASGVTNYYYHGLLAAPIAISPGVTPYIETGTTIEVL